MGSVSNLFKTAAGTLTGGLLMQPDMPDMPKPPKERKTLIDPNYGKSLAAARRRKLAAAGDASRQNFRIDLSTGASSATDAGRSGIVI